MNRHRHRWIVLLRVLLSFALLLFLLHKISVIEIVTLLEHSMSQWPLLLVAFILPGIGLLIAGLRWQILLAVHSGKGSINSLLAALLVGTFFNQFFPSTIGGDLVRSHWVAKSLGSSILSLTVVVLDRALGLLGICILALLAVVIYPAMHSQIPWFWFVLVLVALGAGTPLAFTHPAMGTVVRWVVSIPFLRGLRDKARLVYEALEAYRQQHCRLFVAFWLSFGLQLSIIVQYIILAAAFDLRVSPWEFGAVIPIVTLVSLVPVTINGVGLRENALVLLGAPLGINASVAVALGGLFMIVTFVYALLGGIIYFYVSLSRQGR